MKKNVTIIAFIVLFAQFAFAQLSWQGGVTPESNQPGTLLFNAVGTPLAGATGTLYLHTGVTINNVPWQNVIGAWGNNTTQPALTLVSANLYKLDMTPSIQAFYGVATGGVTRLNAVVRNAAGTAQSADLSLNVGAFNLSLVAPVENSTTIANGAQSISAQNTGGSAIYVLRDPNGVRLDSAVYAGTYTYSIATPINGQYSLRATKDAASFIKYFNLVVNQTPVSQAVPAGMRDGVNYNANDQTKVTLVLNAPGKDFVYVAGNFNNWQPTAAYSMKRDPAANGKFWIEIQGLTEGQWYAFQYWVCDNTPNANSPRVVKTADPFSTLVLSPFDDPEVVSLNTYPGIPVYNQIAPKQDREVSVIQTGANAYWKYNWTSTTKPNANIPKKDLVIYELLVRDFDSRRTYQDLIDKIDYFKNLKVNAIQLMPVMEFEGNLSWGYNPVYHLAPDKRYGSPAKLKEFIDLCHQNNIAVILDVALNHVFGRSPLERMWMIDTDNDGWANGISPDNPYCNTEARHVANVGSDLNHFREPDNLTNTYVQRTVEHWINEYKIDGFRWDLTQGFTNNCNATDGTCTYLNQPDRIAKLRWYADMQWSLDPNFYVIFEHWAFGEINEYTYYRLNETPSKGVMCWRRGEEQYANLVKGNATDISSITDAATFRIQGNMESHDEERLVFKATSEAGQTNGSLTKALARMPAMGSMFFLVPGPKMIWHFAELGWNLTQNTCSNGTVGDCRLDTKPQPQWSQNWMNVPARRKIYDDWAKMIELRSKAPVFENGEHSFNLATTGRPRLDVWTSTQPTAGLSYVMVHANFSNSEAIFQGFFPYTGTWYNLMDNTPLTVTSTTQIITLAADGGYVVYGNAPNPYISTVSVKNELKPQELTLNFVNPVENQLLSMQYEAENAKTLVLTICSIDGKVLHTEKLNENKGTKQIHFPYAKGMYLLSLTSDKGTKTAKVLAY